MPQPVAAAAIGPCRPPSTNTQAMTAARAMARIDRFTRTVRISFPFRTNEFPFSALTRPFVRRNCLTAQGLRPVLRNSDARPDPPGLTSV